MKVPSEFEIALTLLGEEDDRKWTLLNIEFLVQNFSKPTTYE